MNPPYKPVGTGIESQSESAKIARHEICCNIEDAVKAAAYLLKFGGRFALVNRADRLAEVLYAMKARGIEPKRLQFVRGRAGAKPYLVLVEGVKGAKPGLDILEDACRGLLDKIKEMPD